MLGALAKLPGPGSELRRPILMDWGQDRCLGGVLPGRAASKQALTAQNPEGSSASMRHRVASLPIPASAGSIGADAFLNSDSVPLLYFFLNLYLVLLISI